MTVQVILNHACLYRNQTAGANPSVYLDLAVDDRQMEVVAPTAEDLARGRLLQDVEMDSRRNISTRNLINCGIITGHCRVINSGEVMKRVKDDLYPTATMESSKAKELKR